MSNETQNSPKVAAVAEIIMAVDGLLTLANRMRSWLQEKREVGEMTPEEEVEYDAWKEKKFAEWQK